MRHPEEAQPQASRPVITGISLRVPLAAPQPATISGNEGADSTSNLWFGPYWVALQERDPHTQLSTMC